MIFPLHGREHGFRAYTAIERSNYLLNDGLYAPFR